MFLLFVLLACSRANPLPPTYTLEDLTARLAPVGYTITPLGTDPEGSGKELERFASRECYSVDKAGAVDVLCIWTCKSKASCVRVHYDRKMYFGGVYGAFPSEGSYLIHRKCQDDGSPVGFQCGPVRRDFGL